MSKFCTHCGTRMPDETAFCPNCGNAVGQRMPQNSPPPNSTPRYAPPDVTMVTPNIGLGPDGKYRWIYEMSLFRNPSLFVTVWKVFFFVCIGLFVMMALIQAFEGDLDGEAALNLLGVCGIVLGVMTALVVISFLIYAAIMGGKYIAMFEMDEIQILSRLFMNGQEPNERGINEFLDQALAALQGESLSVRKAAMASVQRFAELGLVYQRLAKSAIKTVNLEFL